MRIAMTKFCYAGCWRRSKKGVTILWWEALYRGGQRVGLVDKARLMSKGGGSLARI
jgi:hypothetical protein